MQDIMKPVYQVGNKVIANPWAKEAARMHIQQNCCFYFISTSTGVLIISIGLLISLLEEYFSPNMVRGILKIAMLVPVVLMYLKDNSFHRWLYLQLFCLCQPLIAIVNLFQYQNILIDSILFAKGLCWLSQEWTHFMGSDKERAEADPCDNADDENDDECEADKDQCPVLPGGALKVLFVITPLIVIINLHFAFVLYAHYKNSRASVEDGGANDRYGPDPDDLEADNE